MKTLLRGALNVLFRALELVLVLGVALLVYPIIAWEWLRTRPLPSWARTTGKLLAWGLLFWLMHRLFPPPAH